MRVGGQEQIVERPIAGGLWDDQASFCGTRRLGDVSVFYVSID